MEIILDLIANPICAKEGVYEFRERWPENALVRLLEWLGASKEVAQDVVVLAPLTWQSDSWPALRRLLDSS